jgi:hypothetical protein
MKQAIYPKLPSPEEQEKSLSELALTVKRYREHNDRVAGLQDNKVQICTIADIEIIVRHTIKCVDRAMVRIARIEERLGIQEEK